jgi:glycosyltransferase involved in cell wall biosynthesis
VLVEAGNQAAFARAIVALLLDKELARQIGVEARRRVLDRFVWQQLAEIALEAYRAAGACPEESGSA